MDDKQPNNGPAYGQRLTGNELAEHQKKYQQTQSSAGSEYGPQGQQPTSEYGPQGGFRPPQPSAGQQQPGHQQPGFQQPHFQQPGQPVGGPQLSPQMAQEPRRPNILNFSFWAIVAAGISYLISQLVVVSLPNRGMSDQDIEMLESTMGSMVDQLPFGSIEAYLNSSMMTAVMIGQAVILTVAYVLVGLGIRNGWRSMRILGTIFAALSLFMILSFVSPLAIVFSGIAVILGIVGIVYAWLPASTEYYRMKAWQKAAKKAYPEAPSR